MPSNHISPGRERLFKTITVAAIVSLGAFAYLGWRYHRTQNEGLLLLHRAWVATYADRHLTVPPRGPRDGIQIRSNRLIRDPWMGTREVPLAAPNGPKIDIGGFQYAAIPPHPKLDILIIGASVAWARFATTTNRAYFNQLVRRLERLGHPVRLSILATHGWKSSNEYLAFKNKGLPLRPDAVIFISGLNDATLEVRDTPETVVATYLGRMKEIRDLALQRGIRVIYTAQPFLPEKEKKTELEEAILRTYYPSDKPLKELVWMNRKIRDGLASLCIPGSVWFVDSSGTFDKETATTFVDLWHFTDPGQAMFAEFLARRMDPILAEIEKEKNDRKPRQ